MMDPYTLTKIFMLALCVYREARGEPMDGKLAVAQVIKNRVADSRWPSDYRDVILQPKQFSAFNRDDGQVIVFPKAKEDPAWEQCVHAAYKVLFSDEDYAKGANHYLNPGAVVLMPSWARPDKLVMTLGRHQFYRL